MVLIFTTKHDISTSMVMDWLDYYGKKSVRINGDDETISFLGADENGIYLQKESDNTIINLLDFSACWWRKSGIRNSSTYVDWQKVCSSVSKSRLISIKPLVEGFMREELSVLHEYILDRIYKTIPINLGSPLFDLNRLKVLESAKRYGLNIPSYRIITNTDQLKEFSIDYSKIVTKSIGNGLYNVVKDHRYFTYTEILEKKNISDCKNTVIFPSLLMSYIDKKFEVRSFYIDGKFFSMAIMSQSSEDSKIDYRRKPPKGQIPYKLPEDIEFKLKKVYDEYGLNTGSADIIVTPDDQYYFLEINPVGQFGMTSIPCNYNLEKLVAKYLTYGRV